MMEGVHLSTGMTLSVSDTVGRASPQWHQAQLVLFGAPGGPVGSGGFHFAHVLDLRERLWTLLRRSQRNLASKQRDCWPKKLGIVAPLNFLFDTHREYHFWQS